MIEKQHNTKHKGSLKEIELKCSDSIIYRTPVFPINSLTHKNAMFADEHGLLNNNLFCEALFLASPEFYREINRFSQRKSTREDLDLRISILKYFTRMCTRCTPFGLFAGCGIGKLGERSKIMLSPITDFKSNTRLDMNFLCSLIQEIDLYDIIKSQIKLYPNSSIYPLGKNLRYTEYKYVGTRRNYTITEVESSDYLLKVLEAAVSGCTVDKLTNLLINKDIIQEDAKDYIDELITNQILFSQLEPSVTGNELLDQLIENLAKLNETDDIISKLRTIKKYLQDIDQQPIGRDILVYQNLKKLLEPFTTRYIEKYLFQSDLLIQAENATVSKKITDSAYKAICVFNRLSPKTENPFLKKFIDEFYKRYEDEEVPLAEALDVETGIGFGNADGQLLDIEKLLEGLPWPSTHLSGQDVKISAVYTMLIKKYEEFLKYDTAIEIEIKDKDLLGFEESWDDLPESFSTIIEVIRTEESSQEPLICIRNAGGSSAANLLGRFCYMEKQIHEFVVEITANEQRLNTDKIIAEIAHLPESRIGNILMRPNLREYEIPYLANTSMNKESVIQLTDLMISVPQGRYVKLRSKRLDKEIIPKLTCAHNYSKGSLPIYHFLCSLQTQGVREGIGFNWGALLGNKAFLPRVRYENAILSPAIWNISSEDIKNFPDITDQCFSEKVAEFKNGKKIPDKVLLVQGDNKLLIDFNHPLSVQMLFSEVKKKGFRLEEFLFDEKYPLIKRDNDTFTNQVVLCFYKNK